MTVKILNFIVTTNGQKFEGLKRGGAITDWGIDDGIMWVNLGNSYRAMPLQSIRAFDYSEVADDDTD